MGTGWKATLWFSILVVIACMNVQLLRAQTPDCSGSTIIGHPTLSCRTVVPSIDILKGGNYSDTEYTYISVTCYHTQTPDSTCAGGGDFDELPSSDSRCSGASPNDTTIVNDAAS